MNKYKHIFKQILIITFLVLGKMSFGQYDKYNRAVELYNSKIPSNMEKAAHIIDSVIKHPETKVLVECWTVRAGIYYVLYTKTDKNKLNSALRDTVLSSIAVSNQLKPDSNQKSNNEKLIKALAKNYFNISVHLLNDSNNNERSLIAYNRYKMLYKQVDPSMDFKASDIKYNLAVAGVYHTKYGKDSTDKSLQTARSFYLKVLDIEPDNNDANMGLGLLVYNEAANLSKSIDFEDLQQLEIVQDNMVRLAKQSEQFILKVYNNDKKNPKAVEALYYIYRMLLDNVKHEDFKKKCQEMGILVNEEKPNEGK